MNTSLINFKNITELIKKYAITAILVWSSFGLLFQVGNIYLFKQAEEEDKSLINPKNMFLAIKKGILITIINIVALIVVFTNTRYIYYLDYNRLITYTVLLFNYIFLFELLLANIFFAMFATKEKGVLTILKKSLIVGNLNIGLAILLLLFGSLILGCIAFSPMTGFVLIPVFMVSTHRVFKRLEQKYIEEQKTIN